MPKKVYESVQGGGGAFQRTYVCSCNFPYLRRILNKLNSLSLRTVNTRSSFYSFLCKHLIVYRVLGYASSSASFEMYLRGTDVLKLRTLKGVVL